MAAGGLVLPKGRTAGFSVRIQRETAGLPFCLATKPKAMRRVRLTAVPTGRPKRKAVLVAQEGQKGVLLARPEAVG